MLSLVAALLLAAPPEHARFVFALLDMPVGIVDLSVNPKKYTYRSIQWFRSGPEKSKRERVVHLDIGDDKPEPVFLWLWRDANKPSCVPARQELGNRVGPVCVVAVEGDVRRGTVFGDRFEARYSRGRLVELKLAGSRFIRSHVKPADPPDLSEKGVPISGPSTGVLTTSPAISLKPLPPDTWTRQEAEKMAAQVNASFEHPSLNPDEGGPDESEAIGPCLAHARRFVRWGALRNHRTAILYGFYAEGDRAVPHAWIRVRLKNGQTLDLDPTRRVPVTPSTHVPIGVAFFLDAGELYLKAYAGQLKIERQPGAAQTE